MDKTNYVVKSVPSSFVFSDMKLQKDKGAGEAKLFVGPKSKQDEIEEFFKFDEGYTYRFDKRNLLEYLHEVKIEFVFQKINQYKLANALKWNESFNAINEMSDSEMTVKLTEFTDASRVYVRADEELFKKTLRKMVVPKLTDIIFTRYDEKKEIIIEVKVNYNFESENIDIEDIDVDEDSLEEQVTRHNLFGLHIKNKNDALSEDAPHICIGWSSLGDITRFENIDELAAEYDQQFTEKTSRGRGQDLGQLRRFWKEMSVGDFVIYAESTCFHIGRIESDCYYDSEVREGQDSDYRLNRKVTWLKTNIPRDTLSESMHNSLKTAMSVFKLNDYRAAVVDLLNDNYVKDDDIVAEDPLEVDNQNNVNAMMKSCMDVIRNPRDNRVFPLNFIVYGAPGTGKTYSMVEYALSIIDGVSIDDFRKSNADRKANVSRYKELVKAGQIVFTTFHQNYGYEEFIQGLRPDKDSETMAFKTVDGVFKVIADTALNDTENKNYVIIIDEINRANISKVFGELITLIEEDKRWGELNETSATLQSGDQFAVPNNLYIVGTMNSADKSISLIDAALRRRFDFIEQKPDSALVPEGVLRKMFDNINENLVSELDSTDLLVGHSYFMKKTEKDLCNILNNNIIPLLYEYFYDNRKKVAKLLKDAIDKSGAQIEIVDEKVGRLRVKDKVE